MNKTTFLTSLKKYFPGRGRPEADDAGYMRMVLNNAILHLHPTRVPVVSLRFTYTWGLGGVSALLAAVLVVTGVMLMFRYDANVDRAYITVQAIETQVPFGSLVRAIHHWSANLLVFTTALHLLRVFLSGGFKGGRTVNWLVGVGLLVVVLGANFTGYLLPWDQLAYWASTVATSLLDYIPRVGTPLRRYLLAGPEVGQAALTNFYALHVAVLPVCIVLGISYHFWKIRKNGGISYPETEDDRRVERVTTIPNLVQQEFAVAALVLAAVVVWSILVPAPLGELADPTNSPNPAKAAWFLMGFQELLLHMNATVAMVLVGVVFLLVMLVPAWDPGRWGIGVYFRSETGRRAALLGVLSSLVIVPAMVFLDEFEIHLLAKIPGLAERLPEPWVPLLVVLVLFAAVYLSLRILKAKHSEAVVGLFCFMATGLVVLTVIGYYFRGENMALVLPF